MATEPATGERSDRIQGRLPSSTGSLSEDENSDLRHRYRTLPTPNQAGDGSSSIPPSANIRPTGNGHYVNHNHQPRRPIADFMRFYRGNGQEVNNNYNYQYEVRFFLVILATAIIGLMYVQVENNSLLKRQLLVPRSVGHVYAKPDKRPAGVHEGSPPLDSSTDAMDSDMNEMSAFDDIHHPEIHPDYQLHAKYLSTVLKNLGDMIRKFETNNNITKPLGGIIELSSRVQEEDDKPEYMKKLTSIIDELKAAKTKVKKKSSERFQEEAMRKNTEAESTIQEKQERKRRIEKEWETLFEGLMDMAEENHDEEKTDEENFVNAWNSALNQHVDEDFQENVDDDPEGDVITSWYWKRRAAVQDVQNDIDRESSRARGQRRGDQPPTDEDRYAENSKIETLTRQGATISDDEELETMIALHKRMIQARNEAKEAQAKLEEIIRSSNKAESRVDYEEALLSKSKRKSSRQQEEIPLEDDIHPL